jgi:hypothetical protein
LFDPEPVTPIGSSPSTSAAGMTQLMAVLERLSAPPKTFAPLAERIVELR